MNSRNDDHESQSIPEKTSFVRLPRFDEVRPLTPPRVDPQLERLSLLVRIGETIRYAIERFEFWVSPSGLLREWLRFNITVALVLGIPALLVTPVVTVLLSQAATWSLLLLEIVDNLMLVGHGIGLVAVWGSAIYLAIRLLRPRSTHRPPPNYY